MIEFRKHLMYIAQSGVTTGVFGNRLNIYFDDSAESIPNTVPYHLYVISDNHFNPNDWVIDTNEDFNALPDRATWDEAQNPWANDKALFKIIASNNAEIDNLPKLSKLTILKFITERVFEVLVEYEDDQLVRYDNCINCKFPKPQYSSYETSEIAAKAFFAGWSNGRCTNTEMVKLMKKWIKNNI